MSRNRDAGDGPAVEARGLVKVYGRTRALDGIDLTVRRGQVFGFLGPNGAGKTTTIRILATLARPDGGTARVLGGVIAAMALVIAFGLSLSWLFAATALLVRDPATVMSLGLAASVAWSLIATAAITGVFAPLTLHLYGKQR